MAHQSAEPIAAVAGGIVVVVSSFVLFGVPGLEGAALGVALGCLTLWSLRLIANAIAPHDGKPRPSGTTSLILAVKFPVVLVAIYLATRLPTEGIYCFLAALALVYSAFVWHLARAAG